MVLEIINSIRMKYPHFIIAVKVSSCELNIPFIDSIRFIADIIELTKGSYSAP